jgi:hypothetical protein
VPRSLSVMLSWTTSGKGTTDAAAVWTQDIPEPRAKGEKQIGAPLPDGPYSFSGKLISLQWRVELVANKDISCAWEFVLGPDGAEILLGSSVDAPRLR